MVGEIIKKTSKQKIVKERIKAELMDNLESNDIKLNVYAMHLHFKQKFAAANNNEIVNPSEVAV